MSVVKQVKVDNWGIYFLQRLKHFFNRTDYCDLTLQFQDNAQLKVHRLVLSACTEYFELLERTCEMYEDRLVMPDDLQADVVVPIVNFMYTGQLEFKMDLLEKLYQTSLVMNMPVLSKLLNAHRQNTRPAPVHSYSKNLKPELPKQKKPTTPTPSSSGTAYKRTYLKAFEPDDEPKSKRSTSLITKVESTKNGHQSAVEPYFPIFYEKNKTVDFEPRPTRYELPEELDEDNITDNSFTNISYNSKPLVVHPETVKQYGSKKANLFEDASSSKKFFRTSPNDLVECRKISNIFDDGTLDEDEIDHQLNVTHKEENMKDASQLFDEIVEEGPKLTIETKDSKQANNIDHAKIISEVLKKYPHLMKSNKNIKLKILDNPAKVKKSRTIPQIKKEIVSVKNEEDVPDFTYQSDVLDSKEAARLISMGAENIRGPWICLICGTPGRALHFTTYYKFRRHLVDVHNEKPIPKICEYCGLKSLKRNYLLYHLYTKHGVPPPANYVFPKCNYCNYIALTEALLVKHKISHTEHKGFRCYVCASTFGTSNQLLVHIQKSGHKYSAERKANLQCIYCLKVFLREANLYTHLKTNHKEASKSDGIIDNSDEEMFDTQEPHHQSEHLIRSIEIQKHRNESDKTHEAPILDDSYESVQYQLEQKEDGNIKLISKRPHTPKTPAKHKILNAGLESQTQMIQSSNTTPKKKVFQDNNQDRNNFIEEIDPSPSNNEEILLIDNNEYIIQNNQLIPKKERNNDDYTITNSLEETMPTLAAETLLEFQNIQNAQPQSSRMIVKKNTNINQPIQIVVSNEEEYKALMASNHSIIFDNSDPNKTLTVLTTQSCTPLETNTIDLEATQSNEINIPDNYPISVSETISADNSNIVVLYSHPIDDQNKQFHQEISQSLEAQFVQSSSIMTQNFETVTTCSPVISTHAVNTNIDQPWQQTLHENQAGATTLATVTTIESISDNNLNELPSIQLQTTKELPIDIAQQTLVSTNDIVQTVNIYNQSQGVPITQSMIMTPGTNILITEEVTSNNNINRDDQNPVANSLELLQQNITSDIPPHSSVIVENSSQLDLPDLTAVGALCQNTGNGSNSESVMTANINMIQPQIEEISNPVPDDIEEISEQVEIHQQQEILECPSAQEVPEDTSEHEHEILKHADEITEYTTEAFNHTEEFDSQTEENTEASQEITEHTEEITELTEDISEQTSEINKHIEEISEHNIQEHSECGAEISEIEENVSKQLKENSELENVIEIPEYTAKDAKTNDDLTTVDTPQDNTIQQSIEVPDDSNVINSATDEIQENNSGKENSEQNNYENKPNLNEDTENQIAEKLNENDDDSNILENHVETQNNNSEINTKTCVVTESVSSKISTQADIENLASEWSEDENDTQNENTITNSKEPISEPEIEESIENIQEEINKHLASSGKTEPCVLKEQRKSSDQVGAADVSNEKISSLLDDWDDNDSQEESASNDQPELEARNASEKDNGDEIETTDKEMESINDNTDNENIAKPDNIKSLVSDWDEEEEQETND